MGEQGISLMSDEPPMSSSPRNPGGLTPPASVPLTFFAAAGIGLIALGLITWFAADHAVISPRHPGVLSVAHVALLAFLTTAVLGALHQFAPVVGKRAIRSVFAARLTAVCMIAAAWLLPNGFAHGPESLVLTGAVLGAVAVGTAAWNLSGPVGHQARGVSVWGIRLALSYLVLTVGFGVVYAADREWGWFPLLANRVLAHAHLGLIGWLGLTYVAVAEKLWPMFLLSHRPSQRSGALAVGALAAGALPLALGLLFGVTPVALVGGAIVVVGLLAHLTSLVGAVRHRRRPLELLHAFLFSSAAFLLVAIGAGVVAAVPSLSAEMRPRVVAAEVAALIAWLGLAVIGHAHKIVPFIAYSVLRTRGIRRNADGSPLLFANLYDRRAALAALVLLGPGYAAVILGLLSSSAGLIAVGGVMMSVGGAIVVVNLTAGPLRALRLPPSPSPARRPRPAAAS